MVVRHHFYTHSSSASEARQARSSRFKEGSILLQTPMFSH